ncbi:tetratricopeptide repeat protein [candidate division WOR-3 bacterium]|nr:tetratricopeptide repeat protein [candidate division WOR-3 bacterium]
MLRKKTRLRLRSFIPRDMIPAKGERVEIGGGVSEHTLLLVDITGFSELSERLTRQGIAGSEELTSILNTSFERMLAAIHAYGGLVIFFSGDALFSIFPGIQAETRLRALTCADKIRSAIRKLSPVKSSIGNTELRVSIAVNAGEVNDFRIGNEERILRVLTGDTANILYRCERMTAPDTIRIMPDVAEDLHEKLNLRLSRESFELLELIEPAPVTKDSPLPDDIGHGISALLPFGLVERLTVLPDERSILEEHRYGTVMFVNFYDLSPGFNAYNEYFNKAWRIVHKFGGVVEKIDLDSYGDRLMALFGTPIACEDDEKRAVFAAKELITSSPAGAAQRIGISSGPLFTCIIGSEVRKTFTVMGHTVIFAARQLEAADEGEIRIGERTWQQVSAVYETTPMESVAPFGKGTGEHSFILDERKMDVGWLKPPREVLVGREPNINRLLEIADEVKHSKRGFVSTVMGDTGIGKTRMIQEFADLAVKKGFNVAGGRCASYGRDTPYLPWTDLLHSLLAEGQVEVTTDALKRAVDSIERPAWSPILAPYLGLKVADNEFTISLNPEARKQKMFALVLELIVKYSEENPLLLIFENMQWIDSLSRELIGSLIDLLPTLPVMLVLVTRPLGEVFRWQFLPIYAEMRLFALGEREANQLIYERLGSKTVDPTLLKLIHEATQGNPFYIGELIHLLINTDSLERKRTKVFLKEDADPSQIPPTIHRVISTRIDLLNERAKGILQIAAVIGQHFTFDILNRIQNIANNEALQRQLGLLVHYDLVTGLGEPGERSFEFKNILIREVAYNTLSFAKRRAYHELIAKMLEKEGGESEQVLVHHYQHTQDSEKTLEYLEQSASRAAEAYANQEALHFLDEALNLLTNRKTPTDISKRFELLLIKEGILSLIADRKAQRRDLNTLLALALESGDENHLGQVLYREARFRHAVGEYTQALVKAKKAEELLGMKGDPEDLLGVIRITAQSLQAIGRFDEALQRLQEAHVIAGKLDNPLAKAGVLGDFGRIHKQQGEYGESLPFFERSMEFYREARDRTGEIMTAAELGVIYKYLGLYEKAIGTYQSALKLVTQIGDKKAEGRILGNLAITLKNIGEVEKALSYCQRALEIARKIRDRHGEGMLLDTMGNIKRSQGHFEEARDYLSSAIEIARDSDERPIELKHLCNLATVNKEVGYYKKALELLERSLEMAKEVKDRKSQGLCLEKIGVIKYELGSYDEAVQFLHQAQEIFEESEAGLLYLQTLLDISEIYIACGNLTNAEDAAEQALIKARTKGLNADEASALRVQAEIKLAERDSHGAFFLANKAVKILNEKNINNLDVSYTYYKVLKALGKKEAACEVLEDLHFKVTKTAEEISDIQMKESYLYNVAINREIIKAREYLEVKKEV